MHRNAVCSPFNQDEVAAKAWVQTIGREDGHKLRVATLWDGSRLLAVLPLVRRRYLGARLVEWIGARVSDYCDALVHPSINAGSALLALWDAVMQRGDCDVVRLGQVPADAKRSPAAYEPLIEAIIKQKSAWTASKGLGVLLGHPDGPQFLRKCAAAMAERARCIHTASVLVTANFLFTKQLNRTTLAPVFGHRAVSVGSRHSKWSNSCGIAAATRAR